MYKTPTVSNYDFEDMILSDTMYIDKTDFVHKMVSINKGEFFLARPRRFGKSLMVSTLKNLFRGKRHLFKDLKIDSLPYDWKVYPVIHLNMADINCMSSKFLIEDIQEQFSINARNLNIEIKIDENVGASFGRLIRKAAESSEYGKVVLLIDEYDKPLVTNLGKPHLEMIREALANFYLQIKNNNDILRFTFITGITRFSKVSIFSNLNHLYDLSLEKDYANMLGYTDDEIEHYFGERIDELAVLRKIPVEEFRAHIKRHYNGYCFAPDTPTVYNPVSLGRFFNGGGFFSNYWFETGTPTYLLKLLSKDFQNISEILNSEVNSNVLSSFDPVRISPLSLLYQTGYLTIESAQELGGTTYYRFKFPNREVQSAFTENLLEVLTNKFPEEVSTSISRLIIAIMAVNIVQIEKIIFAFFATMPYENIPYSESNFRGLMFALFSNLSGISMEQHTNWGRIDKVITTETDIFVIEYKYNHSAEKAMAQIYERKYYEPFLSDGKPIHLLGINYNPEARNIDAIMYERLMH